MIISLSLNRQNKQKQTYKKGAIQFIQKRIVLRLIKMLLIISQMMRIILIFMWINSKNNNRRGWLINIV